MVHGDDDGIILPPRIASAHIVIIPLIHDDATKEDIHAYCHQLKRKLQKIPYRERNLVVEFDKRDIRGGEKVWSWIKKGVPIRIEIGKRELAEKNLSIAKRNKEHKDIEVQSEETLLNTIIDQLEQIQDDLYQKAKAFRDEHLIDINTEKEFYKFFSEKKGHIHGGFARAHWAGNQDIEERIQKDLNVTIRCIPMDGKLEEIA